ncbi:MAG: hypothetical protein SFV18_18290 [Bryobacteraceae bacterium]|nr:hypothetical protein [Bryobacteraceae bacterium]
MSETYLHFGVPLGGIADAAEDLCLALQVFEPIQMASTFGGLLALPKLQANCLRLEALSHLAVAYCSGTRNPASKIVRQAFSKLGRGYCGRAEDPPEDVFVSRVHTTRGNFRIFEGIREGNAFYLQRLLNVVEDMPNDEPFLTIQNTIHALLFLSELVAERAGLREFEIGSDSPLKTLPSDAIGALGSTRRLVCFDALELKSLADKIDLLGAFAFDLRNGSSLIEQSLGHSDLERRPLLAAGRHLYLVLPTAVGSAITRYLLESINALTLGGSLAYSIEREYSRLFSETPLLGIAARANVQFQSVGDLRVGIVEKPVDSQRTLTLFFFLDGLKEFDQSGLCGVNPDSNAISEALNTYIDDLRLRQDKGKVDKGICLAVGCGIGRGCNFSIEGILSRGWLIQGISAYDLCTVSLLTTMQPLDLWRVLEAQQTVSEHGVTLLNINGLLNLIAWADELGGHVVPHGQLPDDFISPDSNASIMITQNALLDLRQRVFKSCDARRVLDANGEWIAVRRFAASAVDTDGLDTLYVSDEVISSGRLRGVCLAGKRPWWIEIHTPEGSAKHAHFEHWRMTAVWVSRAAPVMERTFHGLPSDGVYIHFHFKEPLMDSSTIKTARRAHELRGLVSVSKGTSGGSVNITIDAGFVEGFRVAENDAERVIIESIVSASALLSGTTLSDHLPLVTNICPNEDARMMHRLEARSFQDYLFAGDAPSPVVIHRFDDASCRIGLGWRVRSREQGANVSGVEECTHFLNNLVAAVIDEIILELRSFNRLSFLCRVIENQEFAAYDKHKWRRTARAMIALSGSTQAVIEQILKRESELNACSLASRVLIEAGICECPDSSGSQIDDWELSKLMARAAMAFHLGGWSNAVRWGAIEPSLRITPLGDVHVSREFFDNIYEPYGEAAGRATIEHARSGYRELYQAVEARPTVEDVFEATFLRAWVAEVGVTVDGIRQFVDAVENQGLSLSRAVFTLRRSIVRQMLMETCSLSPSAADASLSLLTLTPRRSWKDPGAAFADRDWHPWRFRRRLSIIRRPLCQWSTDENPLLLISPGVIREGLFTTLVWHYEGNIRSEDARSREMAQWIGHTNRERGAKFTAEVALALEKAGWSVITEITITKLLGEPWDKLGDVDVLAHREGRVLVVECKDVHYKKTLGEVSEQLADFLGENRADGSPDLLKRHLDRIDILRCNPAKVGRAIGLDTQITIEGHLIFRNPVPMTFASQRMEPRVRISILDDIGNI